MTNTRTKLHLKIKPFLASRYAVDPPAASASPQLWAAWVTRQLITNFDKQVKYEEPAGVDGKILEYFAYIGESLGRRRTFIDEYDNLPLDDETRAKVPLDDQEVETVIDVPIKPPPPSPFP